MALWTVSLVSGCTIQARSGLYGCDTDNDCPDNQLCLPIAADAKRCYDPNGPAPVVIFKDAGHDSGPPSGIDSGTKETDSGRPSGIDSGTGEIDGGRDSGSPEIDSGHTGQLDSGPDQSDSGIQVTGHITVAQETPMLRELSIRVTEAAIEVQSVLCDSENQVCVTGGIRP
jgi:hypothetical protein